MLAYADPLIGSTIEPNRAFLSPVRAERAPQGGVGVSMGIYRVVSLTQGWGGDIGHTNFYWQAASSPDTFDAGIAQTCADRVHAFWSICLGPFPPEWNVHQDSVVDFLNETDGTLLNSTAVDPGTSQVGTSGYEWGSLSAMTLCRHITADIVDGRRVQGRHFYGPMDHSVSTAGAPGGSQKDPFGLAWTAQLGEISEEFLVVWSRPRRALSTGPHPHGARAGSAHRITGITFGSQYATLRSRRPAMG